MDFLSEFLHQEVPKSGRTMPAYYRKALFISEAILIAYFAMSMILLAATTGRFYWPPAVILFATALTLASIDKKSARVNLGCFSLIIVAWLTWFVWRFGWAAGSPNILVPILSLAFFNIFVPPKGKIAYFVGLVVFRVGLFAFSLYHTAPGTLDHSANIFFQILNSVTPLSILAVDLILFSSSIQASERQLTINNQALHKEAGTDALTGLPNRRAMLDVIEQYLREKPEEQFSVAIADIDFFKRVNDTYGHNCGDYTLRELSSLFLASAGEQFMVCRWGGEEFSFFLPGQNIDQAGEVMHKLHEDVKKLPLRFGDVDFNITITVGVEENDYQSSIEQILDRADRKLYMGKVGGRDRVVI